ncbi:MAG: DNA primase [Oscillospiraceae bacterium]|nr:DNA primase [Oscillospiraceae bacterium]
MALPETFFERIRQANDIVTVMSGVAQLKKAGRDYVCLCPFHSEKTPSCHVYTDSQSFYCFGCGLGGDVITFTRLTENLDYMGAVRLIAERSGIPVPEDGENSEQAKAELQKRARIYEMNKEAAKFFVKIMLSEDGKEGLAFLRNRGLTDNTIRKYGLGYAPNSWDRLKRHMNSLGYSDVEMIEASLLREKDGRMYDMFRARAMFPVIDRTGKVLAFSGRRIDNEKDYKYVNSRETPVYIKGDNIFSINFAKNSKKKTMILCEGNVDAVMLNQAGFDNAVAVCGTALTPAQARLLRFYCEEVIFAYDSDMAGEKATEKAINLFNREGISARVIKFQGTGAKDPDDYIKMYGAESFAAFLEKSVSTTQFELDKLKSVVDLDSAAGKSEYLKKAVAFLANIESPIDRMVYVSGLAKDCEVTVDGVQGAIESAIKSKKFFRQRDEKRELFRSVGVIGAGNTQSDGKKNLISSEERAENGIIAFLFHSPDKLPVILRNLSPMDFPTAFNRKLFETLILRLNKRQSTELSSLGGEFSAEEVGRIKKIKIDNAELPFTDERLGDYINVLTELKQKRREKTSDEMTNEEALAYINHRFKNERG